MQHTRIKTMATARQGALSTSGDFPLRITEPLHLCSRLIIDVVGVINTGLYLLYFNPMAALDL